MVFSDQIISCRRVIRGQGRPLRAVLVLGLLLSLSLVACKDPDDDGNPTAEDEPSGYPEAIEKIFTTNNCTSCHGETRREAGLGLHKWSVLFEGDNYGALVFPGNAQWSHLLWHVNYFGEDAGFSAPPFMPYRDLQEGGYAFDSTNMLTREEYDLLRQWVANGAPNNEGVGYWDERKTENRGKFFFLNQGSDLVGVVDLDRDLIMEYFEVGNQDGCENADSPHYITKSPDGQYIYLSLIDGGVIEKRRASDYSLVATSERIGDQAAHVEISGDGRWAVVSNWVEEQTGLTQNKLVILDTQTMQISDVLDLPYLSLVHGIALKQDFSRVYATSNVGNYFFWVDLDAQNGKFLNKNNILFDQVQTMDPAQQPMETGPFQPYQCILSEDEDFLFVTCPEDHSVHMYDITGGTPQKVDLNRHPGEGVECSQTVGLEPRLVYHHSNRLYVICLSQVCSNSANRSRKGCVSVFNTAGGTLQWETNIYGIGHIPRSLGIDPVRQKMWVVCENAAVGGVPPHHPIPCGDAGHYNVVDISNPMNPQVVHSIPIDAAAGCSGSVIIP